MAERIGCGRLAVDRKRHPGGGFEAVQPAQDFVHVGVSRKHVEVAHSGAHRHVLAVYLDRFCPSHHRRPAGAAGLKSGEQNGIFGIRGVLF